MSSTSKKSELKFNVGEKVVVNHEDGRALLKGVVYKVPCDNPVLDENNKEFCPNGFVNGVAVLSHSCHHCFHLSLVKKGQIVLSNTGISKPKPL